MRLFNRLVVVGFALILVSCGGSGDGEDEDVKNTTSVNTDCVLGASKIGGCTL